MQPRETRAGQLRLRLIEKRSIVYARLPRMFKGLLKASPDRVAPIPDATMAWIENALRTGQTDGPWFTAVLSFMRSDSYSQLELSLITEIEAKTNADRNFYAELRRRRAEQQPTVRAMPPPSAKAPRPPPKVDRRPYFWDNIDPDAWREQE